MMSAKSWPIMVVHKCRAFLGVVLLQHTQAAARARLSSLAPSVTPQIMHRVALLLRSLASIGLERLAALE
jgi:hypothetical protein